MILALTLVSSSVSIGDMLEMCNPVPNPTESRPPESPNVKLPEPVEGYAILEYSVTEEGIVIDIDLIQSYAPPKVPGLAASFALAAIKAVKNWRYEPVVASCRIHQKRQFLVEAES